MFRPYGWMIVRVDFAWLRPVLRVRIVRFRKGSTGSRTDPVANRAGRQYIIRCCADKLFDLRLWTGDKPLAMIVYGNGGMSVLCLYTVILRHFLAHSRA